jgi:hypothetical protein
MLTVILYGDYPRGQLVMEVEAEDILVHRTVFDTSLTRVKQFKIIFTHNFYWQVKREHEQEDDGMGRSTWYKRLGDAGCAEQSCEWDEFVDVRVMVRELEWTTEGGAQSGRAYSTKQTKVKLNCYDCLT